MTYICLNALARLLFQVLRSMDVAGSFWQISTRRRMGNWCRHVSWVFSFFPKNFSPSEYRHLSSRCYSFIISSTQTLVTNIWISPHWLHSSLCVWPLNFKILVSVILHLWEEELGIHPRAFVYHWDCVKRAEMFWLLLITSLGWMTGSADSLYSSVVTIMLQFWTKIYQEHQRNSLSTNCFTCNL